MLPCPECEGAVLNPMSGMYQFKCIECRERFIGKVRCREHRERLLARIRIWGGIQNVPDGVCECKIICYQSESVASRRVESLSKASPLPMQPKSKGAGMNEIDVDGFIKETVWRVAKTMPKIPHAYIVRDTCTSEDKFVDFVVFIRAYGEKRKFWSKTFVYWDHAGYTYWTMGSPVDITTIINRAVIK